MNGNENQFTVYNMKVLKAPVPLAQGPGGSAKSRLLNRDIASLSITPVLYLRSLCPRLYTSLHYAFPISLQSHKHWRKGLQPF